MKKVQQTSAENVMASASRALEKIESRYSQIEVEKPKKSTENEDRNLAEMVYTMLQSIPEGMQKAMLRLELQQKIIQMKYGFQGIGGVAAWPGNNVNLTQTPYASSVDSRESSSPYQPYRN